MNYRHSMTHPAICGRLADCLDGIPVTLQLTDYASWKSFWRDAQFALIRCGYTIPTLRFYRHVLRAFSRHVNKPPCEIQRMDIRSYLLSLAGQKCTWHWSGMNISVLRVLFDKLGGLHSLVHQPGPRRKRPLPVYLSRDEISNMILCAPTKRDQLVLSLLYGCGLRTGELCQLRWHDIDPENGLIVIDNRYSKSTRSLPLPVALRSLLKLGKSQCPPEQYVIPGSIIDQPISARGIQRIITTCVQAITTGHAPNTNPVTPMTLRHSYAVHFLEDGGSVRELQQNLGHETMEATMRYEAVHPILDRSKPDAVIPVDSSWETISEPMFPLLDHKPSFAELLKTRLRDRFLAARRFWNSG